MAHPQPAVAGRGRRARNQGRFFYDRNPSMKLYYQVRHDEPVAVKVELVRASSGRTLEAWRSTVEDDETYAVRWNGLIDGRLLGEQRYAFRLVAKDSEGASTFSASAEDTERDSFQLWQHRFPVRGRHDYGDGLGAGRGHQGQDVFAKCGAELEAARGGKVQYAGYQGSGAGHYLVIDGKKTRNDYVYMHLKRRATVRDGDRVRTGETIGKVGESGNASGCHLHFELWSGPGWYEGGSVLDPTPELKHWDSYS
jgi:murein DD-endopeptidase MepM/ murein hydrolase activator NlpD